MSLQDTMSTPHFKRSELACKCGCNRMEFTPGFLESLESLRVAWNRPLVISSGYRCPHHNAVVSHTGDAGPHTLGAVDVRVAGLDAYNLALLAMTLGWSGIGVAQRGPVETRFIHLDDLTSPLRPRIWSY